MKRSPLYQSQAALGAQMTEFAGWEMPVLYSSVREENAAVRQRAGLFDVSHLGRLEVEGKGAASLLEKLLPLEALVLPPDRCAYSLMCNEAGGILDDLILLRLEQERFLLIVNAAQTRADTRWICYHRGTASIQLEDKTREGFALALQGPAAQQVLQRLCDSDLTKLRRMRWTRASVGGCSALISRTGYTGEDGFEIIGPSADAGKIWNTVLATGKADGVLPCGLAARDLCRLEAGNRLMGQDLDSSTSPLEAGLTWALEAANEQFVGRDALLYEEKRRTEVGGRHWVAFTLEGNVLPRHAQTIYQGDREVGEVTSGNFSFVLGRPIGAGYIEGEELAAGTEIEVEIHGRRHPARVASLPLIKRKEKRE